MIQQPEVGSRPAKTSRGDIDAVDLARAEGEGMIDVREAPRPSFPLAAISVRAPISVRADSTREPETIRAIHIRWH